MLLFFKSISFFLQQVLKSAAVSGQMTGAAGMKTPMRRTVCITTHQRWSCRRDPSSSSYLLDGRLRGRTAEVQQKPFRYRKSTQTQKDSGQQISTIKEADSKVGRMQRLFCPHKTATASLHFPIILKQYSLSALPGLLHWLLCFCCIYVVRGSGFLVWSVEWKKGKNCVAWIRVSSLWRWEQTFSHLQRMPTDVQDRRWNSFSSVCEQMLVCF